MKGNWKNFKIGEFLTKDTETVNLVEEKEYKQITVKMNGKGVTLRGVKLGKEIQTKRQFLAHSGHFILSRIDARNGAFGLVPKELEGAVVTNDFPIFNFNSKIINKNFFDYFIKSNELLDACIKSSKGTTNRQRLKEEIFLNLQLSLPSLNEQEKIVEKVFILENKITMVRDIKSRNMLKVRQLFNRYYIGAISKHNFNATLEDKTLVRFIKRGRSPKYQEGTGVRMLNQKCNRWNEIDLSYAKEVDENWLQTIDKDLLTQEGDILVNSTGDGTIGRSSVVTKDFVGLFYDSHLLLLRVNKKNINPFYLVTFINSSIGQKYISDNLGAKTTKQTELGVEKLKKIKFPLVDLKTQKKIMNQVDIFESKINKILANYNTEKKLASLLPSILDKAFKGELVSEGKKINWFSLKQGIGAIMEALTLTPYERGEMVIAKIMYLLQEVKGVPFGLTFVRHNFGPYDPNIKKAILASAFGKDKFFKVKGTGERQVYNLGDNKSKLFFYDSKILNLTRSGLVELMPYVKNLKSSQIELIATASKIIQDIQSTDLQAVQKELALWKGTRFSKEELVEALNFIFSMKWEKSLIKQ